MLQFSVSVFAHSYYKFRKHFLKNVPLDWEAVLSIRWSALACFGTNCLQHTPFKPMLHLFQFKFRMILYIFRGNGTLKYVFPTLCDSYVIQTPVTEHVGFMHSSDFEDSM